MDVLNVHVLPWIACVRPHQARLVGDAGLDVVDGGRRGRLLQRRRRHVCIGRLLDAVD